jgi:anti-anti-sigma factor
MSDMFAPVPVSTPLHIVAVGCLSPTTVVLAVVGEVDMATAPVLRERLIGVLRVDPPEVIEVDLTGATFLDCAGVGALVAARNAALQVGCRLRVCHLQPIVRRLLEVTGLLGALTASTVHADGRPAAALSTVLASD